MPTNIITNAVYTNYSTIVDVPFLVTSYVSCDWRTTALNTHHSYSPLHHVVYSSTQLETTVWPPNVYRDCSKQIKSGRTECRSSMCMDVLEVGVAMSKMFACVHF